MRFWIMTLLLLTGFAAPALAGDGEFAATLLGAGIGGAVGNTIGHGGGRVVATGAGALVGGAVGNELALATYGEGYAQPVAYAYSSYPYDMFPTYNNGVTYRPNYVAPSAPPPPPPPRPVTYIDDESGSYCRQYSQVVRIGNHVQESYGTACLEPDGSWHIVR